MKSKRFSFLYLLYVHDYDGSSSLLFIYSLFISARLRSSKRPLTTIDVSTSRSLALDLKQFSSILIGLLTYVYVLRLSLVPTTLEIDPRSRTERE